jgi:hypothetical protein
MNVSVIAPLGMTGVQIRYTKFMSGHIWNMMGLWSSIVNEMGHCIHGAYIDSLKLEVRNEWERAEDWRNQARQYRLLVHYLLEDAYNIRDRALDIVEACNIADGMIAAINRETRGLS